jgi:hypothetical protein
MHNKKGFDKDLRFGEANEDSVARVLCLSKTEMKRDKKAHETGNLFVEIGRSHGGPSGINVTEAEHWVFTVGPLDNPAAEVNVIVPTARLREITKYFHSIKGSVDGAWGDGDYSQGVGVLVPWDALCCPFKDSYHGFSRDSYASRNRIPEQQASDMFAPRDEEWESFSRKS